MFMSKQSFEQNSPVLRYHRIVATIKERIESGDLSREEALETVLGWSAVTTP